MNTLFGFHSILVSVQHDSEFQKDIRVTSPSQKKYD